MVYVFDLDDTICDTASFSEQYILNFIKKYNLPYKHIATGVRFAEMGFDWDRDTALKWYLEYGDEMMLHFPCKKGVLEKINKLYNDGHIIIIATARANDWHVKPKEITEQWLKNVGLKYHKLYVGRVDKEAICQDENADVFVDDDLKITSRVAEYFIQKKKNAKTFLSTTEYNKLMELPNGVERLDDLTMIP